MIKIISTLCIFFLILGSIFAYHYYQAAQKAAEMAHFRPPPITVSAQKAKQENWPTVIPSIGHFQAVQGVDLSVQVSGLVKAIHFQSNQRVKKGQLLIELDTDVLEAQLISNHATLQQTKLKYQRQLALLKQKAIAQESVDEAQSYYLVAKATVISTEALIKQKKLYSPFAGKLGIRKVSIGQFFSPGDEIVRLETVDPIYLNFSITEKDLEKIKLGQTVKAQIDAYNDTLFTGKITAISTNVDVSSLGIMVQATFANKDAQLKSGIFSNLNVILDDSVNVVTLPQTAITYSLYGDSVYIIKKLKGSTARGSLIAKQVNVDVGMRQHDRISVISGVSPGDLVVTLGQLKLHEGVSVSVDNHKQAKP